MPVMEIFRTAYGFVLGRMGQFFAVSWPYILILIAFFTAQDVWGDVSAASFGQAILEAFFAFLWHRNFLLGPDYAKGSGMPKGSSKEAIKECSSLMVRFMWRSIGISLVLVLFFVVPIVIFVFSATENLDGDAAFLAVILIGLGVFALLSPMLFRFLPYFPALAVGNKSARFSDAWALTRGKTFSIWVSFVVVLVSLGLVYLGNIILVTAIYEWQAVPELARYILVNTIMATTSIFTLAVGVTANSEIYRRLSGFDAAALSTE